MEPVTGAAQRRVGDDCVLLGGISTSRSPRPWPRVPTTQPYGDRRRPGPVRRGTGTSTTRHGDRGLLLPSRCSSACTTKSPAGRGRKSGSSGTPWSRWPADVAPMVQILDALVPQSGDQLVDAFKHFDISVPEQVIEVPMLSCPPRPLRAALAATQMAEQLAEVLELSTLWWRPAGTHVASHFVLAVGTVFLVPTYETG